MKKQILTMAFALCATYGYSQLGGPTPNVFPATGFVGIGTTSPAHKLQVLSNNGFELLGDYTETIASVGKFTTTGLHFQALGYGFGDRFVSVERAYRLQMFEGASTKTGFIEFSNPGTANTTKAAVSFGHNGLESVRINQDGKVRIGNGTNDIKTPAGYKLFVEDGILTEKVKVAVKTTANWADYVFAEDYKLMPLTEVEQFTKENKHLPNVPSAKQMVENGLDVAQMDAKLMEKVEELTLYLIEQNKQIEVLKAEITALKDKK